MYPHDRFLFDYSMGLSNSGSDELIGWVSDLLHGNDVKRTEAAQSIVSFIDELAASRRKQSAADFMTYIVQAQVQGRSVTDEEVRGIGVIFFIAGLDTVAAALGFDLANLPQSGGSGIAAERADPDRNRSWRIVARLFNRSDYPRGYQRRGL